MMAAMAEGDDIKRWRLDEPSYHKLCDEMFEHRKDIGMPMLFSAPDGCLFAANGLEYREGLLLMGIPVYPYGKIENSTHGD